MHKKHKSRSLKKNVNSNSSNNSSTNTSNTNSNITNNNYVDDVNHNIQNINNIVGCNSSGLSNSDSTQESSTQNTSTSNSSNTSGNTSNITTQNRVSNTNANLQNINTIILSGIESANSIESGLSQTTPTPSSDTAANASTTTNTSTIDKTSTTLQNINNIKSQLARLDLDPRQLAYYENAIAPLLTTLLSLSTISYDLSASTNVLAGSPIVCAKHSKLKDTIRLVYDINDQCEDLYKCLKKRVDLLLDLG